MRPGSIEYDPVLAGEILERLADGDFLASICCDEGMPDERSVRRWARNHGDFGAKYEVARRLGYEKRADELLEIADESSADWRLRQCTKPLSPVPDTSRSASGSSDGPLKFSVEVEHSTIAWLVRLGLIPPNETRDLAAILVAMNRIGLTPSISCSA